MTEEKKDSQKPAQSDNVVAMADYTKDKSNLQALTFELGGEVFAMEVTRVEEITDSVRPTVVPGADPFAPYVINVRGNVVPMIDLRHRFGLPPSEDTIETRTVVFEVELDTGQTKVALKADSVSEVIDISDLDMEDMPDIGTKWNQAFVKGITRKNGQVVIVLNLEEIFNFSLTASNGSQNNLIQEGEVQ